jgi:hypothetical protein
MSLSDPMTTVLCELEPVFSQPTWRQGRVLIVGTLLAHGQRTVTAALRPMGVHDATTFGLSHHGRSRARWSPLAGGRRLLHLLGRTFGAAGGDLTGVIDETLERRWGHHLTRRGHARDPLASSKQRSVATSGVRGIVVTVVIPPPWAQRSWALSVLRVPAPTPEVRQRGGRQHQTVPPWARQLRLVGRRWLPGGESPSIGAQAYRVPDLGGACARRGGRVVAPLRLDAALYEPAPPRAPGTNGRPRGTGARRPRLDQGRKDTQPSGPRVHGRWDNRRRRKREVPSGTAVGYRLGPPGLPRRWGLVRDPTGRLAPRASSSTCPPDPPRALGPPFVTRWPLATTGEERRAQLGLATQRPWSAPAVERTTPCLFGRYSVTALRAHVLYPDGKIPVQTTAWYAQAHATCAAVWAAIRQH